MTNAIDQDGLLGFIEESLSSMQNIESDFIELENDPHNIEITNRIFRPIHSLKGNSSFFGLMNINKFSHRLENLLDSVRKGEQEVNKEIIDLFLLGTEYLEKMLNVAKHDPDNIQFTPEEEEFFQLIENREPTKVSGSVQSVVDLQDLLTEALDQGIKLSDHLVINDLLGQVEKSNKEIKKIITAQQEVSEATFYSPLYQYTLNDIDYSEELKIFGTILDVLNGKAVYDSLLKNDLSQTMSKCVELFSDDESITTVIDELKSMLNFLDDEFLSGSDDFKRTTKKLIQNLLDCFLVVKGDDKQVSEIQKIGEILVDKNALTQEQLSSALYKQKKVGEILVEEGFISSEEVTAALTTQNKQILKKEVTNKISRREQTKTIRIDQAKLDAFANNIGDLFISIDSLNYLKKQLEEADVNFHIISKFTNTVSNFDTMIDQLHESVMAIRRVPLKALFQRFPKVMRDLSSNVQKQVEFKIIGDETVIDKDLLEKIENPLVHILRNAIDHGLESPEERIAKGKPEKGKLTLMAVSDEHCVQINITDDGNGIDPEKVKRTALKNNFLSQNEVDQLSEYELINLIFKPGFSCAEKVSDISGRGVGMDVVLSGLQECQGTVNISSKINEGTEFSIKIPLTKTLVAKEAMLVEAGGKVFAVASEDISTTISSQRNQVDLFQEENCIEYEGNIYRLIDLASFFFPEGKISPKKRDTCNVIVISSKYNIALLVEKVISHQKIVVKDFSNSYKPLRNIKGIRGFTILGNEDIVLITDMKNIVEH